MTGYVNWMAYTQQSKDGVVMTQGNTVADYESVASAGTATAPDGAQYATVLCDVASTLSVSAIKSARYPQGDALYADKTFYCGAGERVEIPNIIAGVSVITVTDV